MDFCSLPRFLILITQNLIRDARSIIRLFCRHRRRMGKISSPFHRPDSKSSQVSAVVICHFIDLLQPTARDPNPHPNPEHQNHRVYTNFFEDFTQTSACIFGAWGSFYLLVWANCNKLVTRLLFWRGFFGWEKMLELAWRSPHSSHPVSV